MSEANTSTGSAVGLVGRRERHREALTAGELDLASVPQMEAGLRNATQAAADVW